MAQCTKVAQKQLKAIQICKIYKISAWKNESKAGNSYLSLIMQLEEKPSDTPEVITNDSKDLF